MIVGRYAGEFSDEKPHPPAATAMRTAAHTLVVLFFIMANLSVRDRGALARERTGGQHGCPPFLAPPERIGIESDALWSEFRTSRISASSPQGGRGPWPYSSLGYRLSCGPQCGARPSACTICWTKGLESEVKPRPYGRVFVMRCADDSIIGFTRVEECAGWPSQAAAPSA